MTWHDQFAFMHKPDPHLGSSGWLVAPTTVGIFIEGVIIQTRKQAIEECLATLPPLFDLHDDDWETRKWFNDALKEARKNIEALI